VRRALDVEGLEALVAADAVVDVDDQVALCQGAGLGQEVGGAALLARPGQAVAQDVGLGDDRQAVGLEAVVQRQHHALRDLGIIGLGRLPVAGIGDLLQAMVGQHGPQALGRALRPRGEQHALAGGRQGAGVGGGGLEQVDAVLGALGGEHAAQLGAHVDHVQALGLERRELAVRTIAQRLVPLLGGQVERAGLQRAIGRLAIGRGAGLVGVLDHRQALVARFGGLVIDPDQRTVGQIVEQGRHPLVEQRQPVLEAGAAAALADGVVERVVARRAELGDIASAEPRDALGVQQRLADRQEIDLLQLLGRALGLGIEGADAFQRVAEQVQAHGLLGGRGIDVDDAAPDRELALFRHGGGADIAVDGEIALQVLDIDAIADLGRIAGAHQHGLVGHPLQQGRRGDDQHGRLGCSQASGQARQGGHALGRDAGRGTDAVVRQAVPRGEQHGLDLGREELQGVGEGVGPGGVAGHEGRETAACAGDVGHHQGVEALGRAGQGQAAGGLGDLLGVVGHGCLLSAVADGADGVGLEAERTDHRQHIGLELRGRVFLPDDPSVDLAIGLLEQGFEGVELLWGQVLAMVVRERPQNEVRFPKAAMPGAEPKPPKAGVVIYGHVPGGYRALDGRAPAFRRACATR
jgi:hypothetical protein